MALFSSSDGHASEKELKPVNKEKLDDDNVLTKIKRHVKRLCNIVCCCMCGVEIPDAPASSIAALVDESKPASIYSRCMMIHGQGYPLYKPESSPSPSLNSQTAGIRIGDVGLVTLDGSFHCLFNVCGEYQYVNPPQLPDNFKTVESLDVATQTPPLPGKHFLSHEVSSTDTEPPSYRCPGPAGAVLELPEGVTLFEAQNRSAFRSLAASHAEDWYKYTTVTRGQSVSNGSLYLVTGLVKSDAWGVAVFDGPSNSDDYLRFIVNGTPTDDASQSRYRWEQSGSVISKVGFSKPSSDKKEPDQCLFLRGLRIMLQQERWDALFQPPVQQDAPSIALQLPSGLSDGLFPGSATQSQLSGAETVTQKFEYDTTLIGEKWTSPTSLFHPSDVINTMILKSVPDVKVALCHDADWCKFLPRGFVEGYTNFKMEELLHNIRHSCEIKIENDCAYLVRVRKPQEMGTEVGKYDSIRYSTYSDHLMLPRPSYGTLNFGA